MKPQCLGPSSGLSCHRHSWTTWTSWNRDLTQKYIFYKISTNCYYISYYVPNCICLNVAYHHSNKVVQSKSSFELLKSFLIYWKLPIAFYFFLFFHFSSLYMSVCFWTTSEPISWDGLLNLDSLQCFTVEELKTKRGLKKNSWLNFRHWKPWKKRWKGLVI